MVKNQSFKARQVDVTANSQRLSKPIYIYIYRDEDLENNNNTTTRKRPILCAKRRKHKHQQLREFFQLIYLRIPKCLEKQSLFCFVLNCEYL